MTPRVLDLLRTVSLSCLPENWPAFATVARPGTRPLRRGFWLFVVLVTMFAGVFINIYVGRGVCSLTWCNLLWVLSLLSPWNAKYRRICVWIWVWNLHVGIIYYQCKVKLILYFILVFSLTGFFLLYGFVNEFLRECNLKIFFIIPRNCFINKYICISLIQYLLTFI